MPITFDNKYKSVAGELQGYVNIYNNTWTELYSNNERNELANGELSPSSIQANITGHTIAEAPPVCFYLKHIPVNRYSDKVIIDLPQKDETLPHLKVELRLRDRYVGGGRVIYGFNVYIIYNNRTIASANGASTCSVYSDDTELHPPYLTFSFIKNANGQKYFCVDVFGNQYNVTYPSANTISLTSICANLSSVMDDPDNFESVEISPEAGPPSTTGGYNGGGFDDSSDTIAVPNVPTLGVSNVGFVNVYKTNENGLVNFGSELFPDFEYVDPPEPTGESITDAINNAAAAIANISQNIPNAIQMYINGNLINYVIDCHIIPVSPTTGTTENIRVGFKTFEQTALKVTTDYVDCDCGTLELKEYYHNFIDYSTKIKLYLPFIGFVPLSPDYFMDGQLSVKYRFNIIDGSFMAYVICTSSKSKLNNSVVASYGGNACVHLPITGLNYSSMVSGVVGASASAVMSGATGNVGGVVSSALSALNNKPDMQQSNGYNATSAYLGVRTPYLLIERVVANYSKDYAHEKGIPSNITAKLSDVHGFTIATDIHIDEIDGSTDSERDEIAGMLANGIIL